LEKSNLIEKLSKIRKLVEVVQKDSKGFNYSYVSITEILAHVTAGMDKYHVSLVPTVVHGTETVTPFSYTKTKILKSGEKIDETINEFLVNAEMIYKWIDNDSGEVLEVPWMITGSQSDPAQALGSSFTYGLRQFLAQYFQIAQPEDDPDNWRSRQKEAAESESALVAKAIIENVHKFVTGYLEGVNEKDKDAEHDRVADLVKKYAKDSKGKSTSNYNLIKDPEIAQKLYDAVVVEFGSKDEKSKKTTKKQEE